MQSDYQRPRRAQAIALTAPHPSNRPMVTVAYALMSAIVVLWLAYLSSVTGSILSSLNIVPDNHAAFSLTINHNNKGDRLSRATFDVRWSALGKAETPHPIVTIPSSCQSGAPCGTKDLLVTQLALAQ